MGSVTTVILLRVCLLQQLAIAIFVLVDTTLRVRGTWVRGDKGSRDRHLNSAEVSMIQYFTFSSNRGTGTLTLAARTAVSHRAPLIDSAGARTARHLEAKVFRSAAGCRWPMRRLSMPESRDYKTAKRHPHNNIHRQAPAKPTLPRYTGYECPGSLQTVPASPHRNRQNKNYQTDPTSPNPI